MRLVFHSSHLPLDCGLVYFYVLADELVFPFLEEVVKNLMCILVIAAIITPSPDWMSQMIVTIPLVLLYEFSIDLKHCG